MEGDGFSFEVQRFGEDLGGGLEVRAFSWSVVVDRGYVEHALGLELVEIGASWQPTSEAFHAVFDAAVLPGRLGIAEVGDEREPMAQGELGPAIESERSAKRAGERFEPSGQAGGGGVGLSSFGSHDEGEARGPLSSGFLSRHSLHRVLHFVWELRGPRS